MKIYFLMPLLFLGQFLNAQVVSGYVFSRDEAGNKIPLPGANLYWSGTQLGTISDEKGFFELEQQKDNYLLVASYVGFVSDTIHVHDGEPLTIHLSSVQELKEVVVSEKQGSSFVSQISPLQVQTITGDELQKAACCNLSESFETNASVDVSYSDAVSGAKKIELLGLHGKYVQMMTENIPNLRGLSTTYGLSYIPGTWMESIQVSKGSSSVVNGYESITGQINVEYKKPDNSDKLFVNAYTNHIGAVEGNLDAARKINEKWSTMLFGHVSNLQNRVDMNNDGFLDVPLLTQYNFFNRWKYRNGPHTAQFGIRVIDEQRVGGQVDFRKEGNVPGENFYGINIDTRRYEVWGKTGYVFPQWEESSLGFINSYTYHDQRSGFGLNEYKGRENTWYSNLIFQSLIGSHNHKYRAGVSFMYDDYAETLNDTAFDRREIVPGTFFEYTYSNHKNLTALLGLRADFHNIYGTFFTPRFHVKYNLFEKTILRTSVGKGYRTSNVIAENSFLLASSRHLIFEEELKMEEAWNMGVNLSQFMDVFGRELNVNLEFYRTSFENQIIVDRDRDVSEIRIYNLSGQSFSNNYQVEVLYELIPRLDLVAAFRYSDVQMTINGELQREPLVNRYKGLLNLSYKTNLEKWQFDLTAQFNGAARLPDTHQNPVEYQVRGESPTYTIINTQIKKNFRHWNIYLGVENLFGFTQDNPIVAADDPFGEYFDASMVWGPIMGRKIYAGIKLTIN